MKLIFKKRFYSTLDIRDDDNSSHLSKTGEKTGKNTS